MGTGRTWLVMTRVTGWPPVRSCQTGVFCDVSETAVAKEEGTGAAVRAPPSFLNEQPRKLDKETSSRDGTKPE